MYGEVAALIVDLRNLGYAYHDSAMRALMLQAAKALELHQTFVSNVEDAVLNCGGQTLAPELFRVLRAHQQQSLQ